MKNEENWIANYEALKTYIDEHHHLPDKHRVENRGLLNFSKYTRKKIKEGTLDEEKAGDVRGVVDNKECGAYRREEEGFATILRQTQDRFNTLSLR